jgi:membrane peptidoglycan carboxypeptidase
MLMVGPLLKLLAAFVLMQMVDTLFRVYNKRFDGNAFSESDSFYFTSIGIIFLIFIELLWHAQNVKAFNATTNMAYLLLDKLHYIVCFLSVYWLKTLRNNYKQLVAAMNRYLKMGNSEKKIVLSPALMLTLTFVVGLLMSFPYFLGLQWIRSNLTLVTVFVLVLGVASLILGKVFSHTWNFMGTVVFDTAMGKSLGNAGFTLKSGEFTSISRIVMLIVAGVAVVVFTIFHFKLLFMFVSIGLLMAVGVAVVSLLIYGLTLLVMFIVASLHKREKGELVVHKMLSYYVNAMLSTLVALKVPFVVALLAFMLVVSFPKRLDMEQVCTNGSIVDTNGKVMYVDTDHERYYVPVSYEEVPEFFRKALVLQEDRYFFEQHDLLPNKSNWHGISFAFLKSRGGSNLNAQLVKNRTYLNAEGFPRDISRKSADMLGGLMLSELVTPEQILEDYVNMASFHGARGFCGVNAAALYAFGRPLDQLNKMEQLYLINTLPHSVCLRDGKHKIPYPQVQNDSTQMVKNLLLKKAEAWRKDGLISKKELSELRNSDLGFTNRPFSSGITIPTRLRLEAEMNGNTGRHLCYTTMANEDALGRAYAQLQGKPAYRRNGSKLEVASLVVDVHTGHIIGHYCSGVNDYTDYRGGFPIGSLGKPAIITTMLENGVSPNMTLFDGQIGKRKTPKNANHGWTCKYVDITTMLSKSLNAPFANICDVANPRTTFLNVERSYQRMGIEADEALCEDTYNYPLGNRQMTVEEMANLYQTIINDGVHIPLRMLETADSIQAERIYDARHVAVVKNAISQTVVNGTMRAYRKQLPQGVTFYSKTGTSSRQKDGWNILSDGNILIVTWASYGRLDGEYLKLGTEPLYGASTAGLFSVLAYNELNNNH